MLEVDKIYDDVLRVIKNTDNLYYQAVNAIDESHENYKQSILALHELLNRSDLLDDLKIRINYTLGELYLKLLRSEVLTMYQKMFDLTENVYLDTYYQRISSLLQSSEKCFNEVIKTIDKSENRLEYSRDLFFTNYNLAVLNIINYHFFRNEKNLKLSEKYLYNIYELSEIVNDYRLNLSVYFKLGEINELKFMRDNSTKTLMEAVECYHTVLQLPFKPEHINYHSLALRKMADIYIKQSDKIAEHFKINESLSIERGISFLQEASKLLKQYLKDNVNSLPYTTIDVISTEITNIDEKISFYSKGKYLKPKQTLLSQNKKFSI